MKPVDIVAEPQANSSPVSVTHHSIVTKFVRRSIGKFTDSLVRLSLRGKDMADNIVIAKCPFQGYWCWS